MFKKTSSTIHQDVRIELDAAQGQKRDRRSFCAAIRLIADLQCMALEDAETIAQYARTTLFIPYFSSCASEGEKIVALLKWKGHRMATSLFYLGSRIAMEIEIFDAAKALLCAVTVEFARGEIYGLRKEWKKLHCSEITEVLRAIATTSTSTTEVERRVKEELDCPYAPSIFPTGGTPRFVITLKGPNGKEIRN